MALSRYAFGSCFIANCIYTVGGVTDNDITINGCEKYDIKSEKWEKCANLTQPTFAITLINVENTYIYGFGGYHD